MSPTAGVKVLFLGPPESRTLAQLREAEGEARVAQTMEALDPGDLGGAGYDFLVSHGYRHIIRPPVLELFGERAFNLHVSYLPWNRGAHPNVWSVIDDTLKGVSVHHIDEGLDTGDLLGQHELEIGPDETLASSWRRLQDGVTALFAELWPEIKAGTATRWPQPPGGTIHTTAELAQVEPLMTRGWDTKVRELAEAARVAGLRGAGRRDRR